MCVCVSFLKFYYINTQLDDVEVDGTKHDFVYVANNSSHTKK